VKDKIIAITFATILAATSLCAWLKPADEYSQAERRVLTQPPELSLSTIADGKFMASFETYALDQFPLRDGFRTVKAVTALGAFRNLDNNDIYLKDGHISKIEYPLSTKMLDHAADRFRYIYNTYLTDNNVYLSIVPDKHYFLNTGRLSLNYEELVSHMRQRTEYMTYIDIFDILSLSDYYRTDSHWKQENILKVAKRLGEHMGFDPNSEFTENSVSSPFYGVYAGQAALPVKPDSLKFLSSPVLESCNLTSYDTGAPKNVPVYDMESAAGRDPYEMFMSGSDALLVLDNPNAVQKRELVIFRDSFASSLTPLIAEDFSRITLVDIRYIQPQMLGNFVNFADAEVLFIYSTSLLNNSLALK